MRNPLSRVLTGWPFLLSLALLIANDTWFKYAWPGWITGKLSDFAGMALLGLLLFALFPRRVWVSSLLLAAGFLYWKSPASDPLIAAFNALGWWNAGRTVDYSDMIALAVLPACQVGVQRVAPRTSPIPLRRLLAWPVTALTLAAMMGTTVMPLERRDGLRQAPTGKSWDHAKVAEAIRAVAERQGLTCSDCSRMPEAAVFSGDGQLRFRFISERELVFEMRARTGNLVLPNLSNSGMAWIEETRKLLKSAFSQDFPGLGYVEYIESLSPPPPR